MPIVAISRLLGSEGEPIAHSLATRLGYRLMDRQTLLAEAEAFGVRNLRPNAPELAERTPTLWQRLNEERRRYGTLLRAGVFGFARGDDAVILGLGASHLLRDVTHAAKVLVVAGDAVRIARVMQQGSPRQPGPLNRARAEEAMQQADREWIGYIRYMFGADMLDARLYDLVLSTDRLPVEAAVDQIALLVARPEYQATAPSMQRLADLSLASRTEVTLASQEGLWVHGLRVQVERGEVVLSGEVVTDEDREAAEQLVQALPGVRRVRNDLRIQPPPLTGM
jgi:cytidylate kinase